MGKRGPKPKPRLIRLLEGNPGRLPINEAEPVSDMPAVKPSAVAMDELASLEWDRLLAATPPGLYSAQDTALLANYAMAWSMLVKAQQRIDAEGVSIALFEVNRETGEREFTHYKTNPAVKVWKASSETLIKLADRLGLHPGARTRLQLPSRGEKPEQSKFAGLLGATKN